ncbi:hypothetical protein P3S68_021272 [Capsicum galapagoense]
MWNYSRFSFNPNNNNHNSYLLPLQHDQNRPTIQTASPISLSAMILTSWLGSRRGFWRYVCLLLCSPFLLPLFCATFPILCVAEICYRLCYRQRRSLGKLAEGDGQLWCEGGEGSVDGGQEKLLLKRYLDDQLLLVIESVYNCGNEEEKDVEVTDSTSLLLQ